MREHARAVSQQRGTERADGPIGRDVFGRDPLGLGERGVGAARLVRSQRALHADGQVDRGRTRPRQAARGRPHAAS